ncbi:hypothetical protein SELMODRAFT_63867, partial [Selaginella moellendorffii]
QKLDHFTPEDTRTFPQKYFELLDYFEPQRGPMFLVMCGETSCPGGYAQLTSDVAKEFGAAVVTLEHRFYGESSPFHNLTVDNLKYLTIQQSLLDHAEFIAFYQKVINAKFQKDGDNPWLVIGGSYAGALSAWFRLKFPHLVIGSWASSAVVHPILSYSAYDRQMGITAGPECKRVLQNVTSIVEKALLENGTAIKSFFDPNAVKVNVDFLAYVAEIIAVAVRKELQRHVFVLSSDLFRFATIQAQSGRFNQLCTSVLNASATNNATKLLVTKFIFHVQSPNYQWAWKYQVCTEMGLFRVSSGPDGLFSLQINTQYYLDQCSQMFGQGIRPDVTTTNLLFGGAKIAGSKIMFLNGSEDPWRHASIQNITSSFSEPSFMLDCHSCSHVQDFKTGC